MSKVKIAVYGTLRKEQSNNSILEKAKYLGEFETKPIFDMYSIGHSFPGIKLGGNTSVKMEVYEVDRDIERRVDNLEGYSVPKDSRNMYDKKRIVTPYGEAYFYTYNGSVKQDCKIHSGDWKEFVEETLPLKNLVKTY